MYIMVPTGMQIINSNFVERFCVVEKPDAALVVASYDRSTVGAHTLGPVSYTHLTLPTKA